jgi:hypothetical protein
MIIGRAVCVILNFSCEWRSFWGATRRQRTAADE